MATSSTPRGKRTQSTTTRFHTRMCAICATNQRHCRVRGTTTTTSERPSDRRPPRRTRKWRPKRASTSHVRHRKATPHSPCRPSKKRAPRPHVGVESRATHSANGRTSTDVQSRRRETHRAGPQRTSHVELPNKRRRSATSPRNEASSVLNHMHLFIVHYGRG